MTTRYIDRPSQFLIENLEILFLYIGEPRMLPELVFEPFAYVLYKYVQQDMFKPKWCLSRRREESGNEKKRP